MKRLPVERMPATRPACAWCGARLKFWTDDIRAQRSCDVGTFASGDITRRVFSSWRGYPHNAPIFHSLTCALQFAIATHRAGYRRTK